MMSAQSPVPEGHPMMQAWERYKASSEYANSFRWAAQEQNRAGSMWAAFVAGWQAATDPRQEPPTPRLDISKPPRNLLAEPPEGWFVERDERTKMPTGNLVRTEDGVRKWYTDPMFKEMEP